MQNDTVVKIVMGLQKTEALNDDLFAQKIGIHRVHWNRIKHGKPFGQKFLMGVINAYPSARNIFLPINITNGKDVMTDITNNAPETSQNKDQGGLLKRLVEMFFKRKKGT